MKKNLIKYGVIAFCLLSNFMVFAQPSSESNSGDLEATAEAPIDQYLLVLALVGLAFVFFKMRAMQKESI